MQCPACGASNRAEAHFCDSCGAPLAPAAEEHRKVVTVLFCDIVGSTALGEATDPEALRALLHRYFKRMKAIVERHGGTLEKFVGDAVMAVFGVPALHEDDALRACRAALEMRDAFPELGLEGRIGLNSGEVVTGTEERLATGDAVNIAARLEQADRPNEVLIGETTLALVRDAVDAEPVESLHLKGKSGPVAAYRLLAVRDQPERPFETRFVGRKAELELLRGAWERVQRERRCELVTIAGDAGVGKSRLVAEALATIDARTVYGRCLPYGDGITYWPVVEVVKQLGAPPSDPAAAASIRSLLGKSEEGTSAEEIAWAFRKLLEQEAPLVVVFDDIHRGEQTFLDLVEHVALLSTGAPVLLLCMARPELAVRRSDWPVTVHLHALNAADVAELIGDRVPEALQRHITQAAGGNPLFVLEMLALAEQGVEIDVPPSLRALLAARLDQLDGPERRVLERAAVEGEVFHRSAVQALAPDEPHVTPRLAALARRGLIERGRAQLPGEDAFRFRHLLIRDAAYEGLPKSVRADLHERLAVWLEAHAADLPEPDQIVGYHLEQAARYCDELGVPNTLLAERAGDRLAAAGRRALSRDDRRAAASLIERALGLSRPRRLDIALETDLAGAVGFDDPPRAAAIAAEAASRARAAGDEAGEAHAGLVAAHFRAWGGEISADELERLARAAVPLLERADDHAGLAEAWAVLSTVGNLHGRWQEAATAVDQAIHHAGLAGRKQVDLLDWAVTCLLWGPWPADDALRQIAERVPEPVSPYVLAVRALLLATLGRFDEAWPLARDAGARLNEGGGFPGETVLGRIAMLEGDYEAAAVQLQVACNTFETQNSYSLLSTFSQCLGRSLCAVGRHEEAEQLVRLGRDLGAPDDAGTQMLWRQVQALVEAHRGEHLEAARLAREAVRLAEQTDAPSWQGDALSDLAEVLRAAGKTDEAAAALEHALERYESNHNWAMAAQVQQRLAERPATAV